ncbi:MAG TPA: hypothetical protein DDW52_22715 [Planctomycetaceae bacterium]|nr:hypothetical protein [Planctomycetaceae bacterium]
MSFLFDESKVVGAPAIGVLETHAWTPAMVALDAMEKAATIQLLQVELNDFLGTCIKLAGTPSDVSAALQAGEQAADRMKGRPVVTQMNRPHEEALVGIASGVEFNPLIQQDVVKMPKTQIEDSPLENMMAKQAAAKSTQQPIRTADVKALGFIETQGFTAVFEAVDTACKAAQVEVVGKEKLGGGYVTIVLRGDVAAVRAAIDAAGPKVEGLGTLIAAHVIARPSESVLSLLP